MSSAKSSPSYLRECFQEFSDPRREHLRLHSLWDIIGLTLCAMICGCDSVVEIHEYGVKKFEFLCTFLDLENGVPSHDTIGRVFAMLHPEKFRDCFARWTQSSGTVAAWPGHRHRRQDLAWALTTKAKSPCTWSVRSRRRIGWC